MVHYKHTDFLPLLRYLEKKRKAGLTVSVVIPTYNEAATIGAIVAIAKKKLMDELPLIDEIVVMDSNSTDNTAGIARAAGAAVHSIDEVLAPCGPIFGKGAAIWKSLFTITGDIIVCIDADILNFGPHFIYGLIGPFLENRETLFAKAYYSRPLKIGDTVHENYGGRVTEILVRPLLSAFAPELAALYQPLSGEYAFLREPIESVPFSSGYGVEIGLIFDLHKKFGMDRFAQVDMGTRIHRNRPVNELGKMSFGIMQTMFRKFEEDDVLVLKVPFGEAMISQGARGMEKAVIREIELPPKSSIDGPSYMEERGIA
jgi:glucosyl-3-phosphoglycerate synthase